MRHEQAAARDFLYLITPRRGSYIPARCQLDLDDFLEIDVPKKMLLNRKDFPNRHFFSLDHWTPMRKQRTNSRNLYRAYLQSDPHALERVNELQNKYGDDEHIVRYYTRCRCGISTSETEKKIGWILGFAEWSLADNNTCHARFIQELSKPSASYPPLLLLPEILRPVQ